MTPNNFLKQVNQLKGQGDGVYRDIPLSIRQAFLASDGAYLTTTTTTNPGFKLVSNSHVLQWDATKVIAAGLKFTLPGDYDAVADDLRLQVGIQMAGSSDTPAMTLAGHRIRAAGSAVALSSPTLTSPRPGAAAGAAATVSSALQKLEWYMSGQSLQPGDELNLNITPGAHGTDNIYIHNFIIRYKSTIVLYTESDR